MDNLALQIFVVFEYIAAAVVYGIAYLPKRFWRTVFGTGLAVALGMFFCLLLLASGGFSRFMRTVNTFEIATNVLFYLGLVANTFALWKVASSYFRARI